MNNNTPINPFTRLTKVEKQCDDLNDAMDFQRLTTARLRADMGEISALFDKVDKLVSRLESLEEHLGVEFTIVPARAEQPVHTNKP